MRFWFCFFLIAAAAIFLRVWQIDLRPLHSDEGVNFHFLQSILRDGYYHYSHENYHGPAFFYLSTLAVSVLGFGELGMRASAVLPGILLLALLLPLRKSEGKSFVLIAALLCALSSSLVFYARYAVHESLFLLSGAACGIGFYMWARTFAARYIYLCGAALAVLIASKETFIITLFCIGLAGMTIRSPLTLAREAWRARAHVFCALLIAVIGVVALFSGGFQWMGGLREMFLAVPQRIGRNESDHGHFKPFWYYSDMLLGEPLRSRLCFWTHGTRSYVLERASGAEPQLILALIIPAAYLLTSFMRLPVEAWKVRHAFLRFSGVWALAAFAVYGVVSYKTPWLVINITFPATLFLAACLSRTFSYDWQESISGAVALAAAVLIAAWSAWRFNFTIPYGAKNPYSYVHTGQGMRDLMRDLDHYRDRHPDAKVLVAVGGYWPLPYYLRDWRGALGYLKTNDASKHAANYQVLIMDRNVNWNAPGWEKKYYRLSDVQESHTYFKE